jgi:hypothetical protein
MFIEGISIFLFMCAERDSLAIRLPGKRVLDKLRSMVVVSRVYESFREEHSVLHAAAEFDLDNAMIHAQVKADYETIREQIRSRGIDSVTGDLGKLVQARTKGRGHGSTTRAFYARPKFVAHILNLQKLAARPRVLPAPGEAEFI